MKAMEHKPRVADEENLLEDTGSPEAPRVTHAMEDYLKAIYRLGGDGDQVTMQRLSEELGLSSPSVTNMVKRLHELELVQHTRYRDVALTPAGEKVALRVIRHHRLLELYLTESLGYDWDQVHAEAERLEHHVSQELEARIASALGDPTRDPHGDPIPSADGAIDTVSSLALADLEAGDSAVISRVPDRDPEQLRYLGELGVVPGQTITVREKFPFDGPIRVLVGADEHLFGRPLAARINVAPHPRSEPAR
jgi:DtxR family transcriptional regulator, Mn-dependent transcriptional regulator